MATATATATGNAGTTSARLISCDFHVQIWGQSNAVGFADFSAAGGAGAAATGSDANAYVAFQRCNFRQLSATAPAVTGSQTYNINTGTIALAPYAASGGNNVGSEQSLGRDLVKYGICANPYVGKIAVASTSIPGHWAKTASTSLYADLVAAWNNSVAETGRPIDVIVHQIGETDAATPARVLSAISDITTFYSNVRADVPGAANAVVLIVMVSPFASLPGDGDVAGYRAQQAALVAGDTTGLLVLLDPFDIPLRSDPHYDAAAHWSLGDRMVLAIRNKKFAGRSINLGPGPVPFYQGDDPGETAQVSPAVASPRGAFDERPGDVQILVAVSYTQATTHTLTVPAGFTQVGTLFESVSTNHHAMTLWSRVVTTAAMSADAAGNLRMPIPTVSFSASTLNITRVITVRGADPNTPIATTLTGANNAFTTALAIPSSSTPTTVPANCLALVVAATTGATNQVNALTNASLSGLTLHRDSRYNPGAGTVGLAFGSGTIGGTSLSQTTLTTAVTALNVGAVIVFNAAPVTATSAPIGVAGASNSQFNVVTSATGVTTGTLGDGEAVAGVTSSATSVAVGALGRADSLANVVSGTLVTAAATGAVGSSAALAIGCDFHVEMWGQSNDIGFADFAAAGGAANNANGVDTNAYALFSPCNLRQLSATAPAVSGPQTYNVNTGTIGLQPYAAAGGNNVGTEQSIGRDLVKYGLCRNPYIGKIGVSSTSIPGHWLPSAGTSLYSDLVTAWNARVAETGRPIDVIVHQIGETDANTPARVVNAVADITTFYSSVRVDVPGARNAVVVVVMVNPSASLPGDGDVAGYRAQQVAYVAGDATGLSVLVDPFDIPLRSDPHYGAPEYWSLGDRVVLAVRNKLFPGTSIDLGAKPTAWFQAEDPAATSQASPLVATPRGPFDEREGDVEVLVLASHPTSTTHALTTAAGFTQLGTLVDSTFSTSHHELSLWSRVVHTSAMTADAAGNLRMPLPSAVFTSNLNLARIALIRGADPNNPFSVVLTGANNTTSTSLAIPASSTPTTVPTNSLALVVACTTGATNQVTQVSNPNFANLQVHRDSKYNPGAGTVGMTLASAVVVGTSLAQTSVTTAVSALNVGAVLVVNPSSPTATAAAVGVPGQLAATVNALTPAHAVSTSLGSAGAAASIVSVSAPAVQDPPRFAVAARITGVWADGELSDAVLASAVTPGAPIDWPRGMASYVEVQLVDQDGAPFDVDTVTLSVRQTLDADPLVEVAGAPLRDTRASYAFLLTSSATLDLAGRLVYDVWATRGGVERQVVRAAYFNVTPRARR